MYIFSYKALLKLSFELKIFQEFDQTIFRDVLNPIHAVTDVSTATTQNILWIFLNPKLKNKLALQLPLSHPECG